jgi:RNA polymerase sigma-70 factor (ECF subfamily)
LNSSNLDDAPGHDSVEGRARASSARLTGAERERMSFEEIYERYFEFVWRSLRLLGVRKESLDDAMQDVFGAVSRQLPEFEGRSSLRTWVFGIAQYTAANHRRSVRRKSAPLDPLDDGLRSLEPSPDAYTEAKQVADLILVFCAELDEGRRTVFVLGLLEDVPPAEIAELLQIPVNTVYSRIRTLRQALRLRLEQREGEQ